MILRRMALAIGLLVAFLGSQLPEFTQQYRQRLGGAADELAAEVARFDAEASAQSLTRLQGIARLEANSDTLAQQRGTALALAVKRKNRLELQRLALDAAGPVSQYLVMAEGVDGGIASQTMASFQPAIPASRAGFVAAAVGLVAGWLLTHLVAAMLPRRRPSRAVPGQASSSVRV